MSKPWTLCDKCEIQHQEFYCPLCTLQEDIENAHEERDDALFQLKTFKEEVTEACDRLLKTANA